MIYNLTIWRITNINTLVNVFLSFFFFFPKSFFSYYFVTCFPLVYDVIVKCFPMRTFQKVV